ncbi:MAG: phosphate ABC transporter permease subunit PstC [Anaerolineae bacterium]
MRTRRFWDGLARRALAACAACTMLLLVAIIALTLGKSLYAFDTVGVGGILLGTAWRPEASQFGILPMVVGSLLVTTTALMLAFPIGLGCAVCLSEVAPAPVRAWLRPVIEVLAGVPSVVYGLLGLVLLVPAVRAVPVPHNTGFGVLAAAVVLAVMIMPTLVSVSVDALRAVPESYRHGSLALGLTRWQTVWSLIVPAARPGLTAAAVLAAGRAIGETMAMIMVIGNSPIFPEPLSANPLTLFLSQARTLTGNIVVEISYAYGLQESALFATGVVLFGAIMLANGFARWLVRSTGGLGLLR